MAFMLIYTDYKAVHVHVFTQKMNNVNKKQLIREWSCNIFTKSLLLIIAPDIVIVIILESGKKHILAIQSNKNIVYEFIRKLRLHIG